ncbi:hypothetical protein FHU10_5002 [Serratia fonticola]|uniref:Uncharacterized protein n=1 Tax=Serratia fonticola TaxID=47917 RepID=A0A542BNH9_SERFO|nr:hypothetical protein FHU09_2701 [Serratia fonticola]TQI97831.1 hypothetical protein FHU11_3342 [Serratia fonticola]TVZ72329.1 hypothetical protein FHU10_5002 [Serratia fonticola]
MTLSQKTCQLVKHSTPSVGSGLSLDARSHCAVCPYFCDAKIPTERPGFFYAVNG